AARRAKQSSDGVMCSSDLDLCATVWNRGSAPLGRGKARPPTLMLASHRRRLIQRLQQFLLADRGSAALHDHDAARVVRQVRGLFGACARSQRSGKSRDDGIAGSSYVSDFIAAVDRNIHRLVAAREN